MKGRCDGQILVYCQIGQRLNPLDIIRAELSAEIQRHRMIAHMEAHIVIAKKPVDDTGNDMLSRMVLHTPEARFPVDSA